MTRGREKQEKELREDGEGRKELARQPRRVDGDRGALSTCSQGRRWLGAWAGHQCFVAVPEEIDY